MTQTSNRIFDEMARLMNDAAGVAQGVRREVDTLFYSQVERILRDFQVVQREEFEAVKEMARLAREENEALKARIDALEAERSYPPVIVPPPPVSPPQPAPQTMPPTMETAPPPAPAEPAAPPTVQAAAEPVAPSEESPAVRPSDPPLGN